MIVYHEEKFTEGYTPITELDGKHANMLMDFGILVLRKETTHESSEDKERAYLLMDGEVEFIWGAHSQTVSRSSLLEEAPYVLHVSSSTPVTIVAKNDAELCVQKVRNDVHFETEFYTPDMVRTQMFGEGTMQGTSERIVRTVFDAGNSPHSGMVLGEVVNYPGKWSSYPPHNHPQPEVYHYRFPTCAPHYTAGFGFGEVGDKVYKLKHQSSLIIEPWVTHPQTAAPGYPMYYLWMIPHLKGAKFGPDSRQFLEEHTWLLDVNASIWPD